MSRKRKRNMNYKASMKKLKKDSRKIKSKRLKISKTNKRKRRSKKRLKNKKSKKRKNAKKNQKSKKMRQKQSTMKLRIITSILAIKWQKQPWSAWTLSNFSETFRCLCNDIFQPKSIGILIHIITLN